MAGNGKILFALARGNYGNFSPHWRHWLRRLAFSVAHFAQRLYILRANNSVSTALAPSIPANTATFSTVSHIPARVADANPA